MITNKPGQGIPSPEGPQWTQVYERIYEPLHEPCAFMAECPECGEDRRQDVYTRGELLRLIETGGKIDAYCVACKEYWAVSSRQRGDLAKQLADE